MDSNSEVLHVELYCNLFGTAFFHKSGVIIKSKVINNF